MKVKLHKVLESMHGMAWHGSSPCMMRARLGTLMIEVSVGTSSGGEEAWSTTDALSSVRA